MGIGARGMCGRGEAASYELRGVCGVSLFVKMITTRLLSLLLNINRSNRYEGFYSILIFMVPVGL